VGLGAGMAGAEHGRVHNEARHGQGGDRAWAFYGRAPWACRQAVMCKMCTRVPLASMGAGQ